jgi:hypothetical protein
MFVYNVTIKIDPSVNDDWKEWMQAVHIPDVLATGYFESHLFTRVISLDESDGITYSIQYRVKDMATLHRYQVQEAQRLQDEHQQRYSEKFVAFRTILEVINE